MALREKTVVRLKRDIAPDSDDDLLRNGIKHGRRYRIYYIVGGKKLCLEKMDEPKTQITDFLEAEHFEEIH